MSRILELEADGKLLDLDTHADQAHTVGIITGEGYAQEYANIVDTRDWKYVEVTSVEASTALPMRSLVKTFEVQQPINYIGFSSSARGNQVIASVYNDIEWKLVGGVYYPFGDYMVPAAGGTVLHRIPTKRGYVINIGIFPNPYSQGYTDMVRLIYGYLPDERETVLHG